MGKSYLKLVPLRQIHWKSNNRHFPYGDTEHTKQRKEANFSLVLFKECFVLVWGPIKSRLSCWPYTIIFIILCAWLFCLNVCLSVCTPCMCIFFGGITEVTNACELSCGCRESNLGPLENQPVFLALGLLFSSYTSTYCTHSRCVYVRGIYRAQCEGREREICRSQFFLSCVS